MTNIDVLIQVASYLNWHTWALLVGALAMLGFSIWEFNKAHQTKKDFDNPDLSVSINAVLDFLYLRTDAHISMVFFVIFYAAFNADVDEAKIYLRMQNMAEQTNTAIENLNHRIEALESGEVILEQPTFESGENPSV